MDLKEHARWLKDNGEAKRYDYLLDNNSLVLDVGGCELPIHGRADGMGFKGQRSN
jgi:hypothetical protein